MKSVNGPQLPQNPHPHPRVFTAFLAGVPALWGPGQESGDLGSSPGSASHLLNDRCPPGPEAPRPHGGVGCVWACQTEPRSGGWAPGGGPRVTAGGLPQEPVFTPTLGKTLWRSTWAEHVAQGQETRLLVGAVLPRETTLHPRPVCVRGAGPASCREMRTLGPESLGSNPDPAT